MKVGILKEIKIEENRVSMTPAGVEVMTKNGHKVYVEKKCGVKSGFDDSLYIAAGGEIIDSPEDIFKKAEMVMHVKEPQPSEYDLIKEDQIVFTYLHLAAEEKLTRALIKNKSINIAYETIQMPDKTLPLLTPMSEVAGRMAIQEGAKYLEKPFGGRGILLGGVPGISRGKVTIIGGGVVGTNACKIAVGIGAEVTILDLSARRLEYLDDIFGSAITTLYSNEINIEESVAEADLVIGAVLIPGAAAPKLVRREHLRMMKPGAVIVDVAVDQGGCVETIHPTYHNEPIYIVDGIVHYGVANMPGVVALSSTNSLTSVTNRYGLLIADNGLDKAIQLSNPIRHGVNLYGGKLTNKPVADATGLAFTELT